MTLHRFGNITPTQGFMLRLAGWSLGRGWSEIPRDRDRRLAQMCEGRISLIEWTKNDFGYDLAAWHAFLKKHRRHGYLHSYARDAALKEIERAIIDPEQKRLEPIAAQSDLFERAHGILTVDRFGRITPTQADMLRLAGWQVKRDRSEILGDLEQRLTEMRGGRKCLIDETKRDFGYDLAAWHAFLKKHRRYGYLNSNARDLVLEEIERAIIDLEQKRLAAILSSEAGGHGYSGYRSNVE